MYPRLSRAASGVMGYNASKDPVALGVYYIILYYINYTLSASTSHEQYWESLFGAFFVNPIRLPHASLLSACSALPSTCWDTACRG